jgi:hypothetical protein
MPEISVNTYVQRARESGDGEIRFAQGEDRLVNKGSLGQRIATFFQGLFGTDKKPESDTNVRLRESHEMSDPNLGRTLDVKDRTMRALEGFKDALAQQYGANAAEKALREAGIDSSTISLTGRSVLVAAEKAEQLSAKEAEQKAQEAEKRQGIALGFMDEILWKTPRDMPSAIESRDVLHGRAEMSGSVKGDIAWLKGKMDIGKLVEGHVERQAARLGISPEDVMNDVREAMQMRGNMHPIVALAITDELDRLSKR